VWCKTEVELENRLDSDPITLAEVDELVTAGRQVAKATRTRKASNRKKSRRAKRKAASPTQQSPSECRMALCCGLRPGCTC